ncbi:hypothetical protein H9Q74_013062 [Fusarium xylarioides]|nr:hypothetical protein H9Q71_012173 [Fusarium xylarioides]KAG5812593.1 hypothetical protein H9Q74_013062 [Fusarium xylarioides]
MLSRRSTEGSSGEPIVIPSDVDSDTEDSDDSDSSLPPARKLRMSAARLRLPSTNYTTSPTTSISHCSETHLEKPVLPDDNVPFRADAVIESPRTVLRGAEDSVVPEHESLKVCTTQLDSNGATCESDDVLTSSTFVHHAIIPDTPHECPGRSTPESSEGQALEKSVLTELSALANSATRTITPTSSSTSALGHSTSAYIPQLSISSPAEVPKATGDAPPSPTSSHCSNISRTGDAFLAKRSMPQTSSQPAATDRRSGDIEARTQKTASPSPSLRPVIRRRSTRQAASELIRYDDDSNSDVDGNPGGSKSYVSCIRSQNDGNYHPSMLSDVEGDQGEEEEDEQSPRKRHKISKSLISRASLRSTTRLAKRNPCPQISGTSSPAVSQLTSGEAETGPVLAKFEQWQVKNAVLKRITENGSATFQLQFDWSPCLEHGHASNAGQSCVALPSLRTISKTKRRASATRAHYTTQEDDLLLELKEGKGLTWPQIHQQFIQAFPGRSAQSLQVHYSTKLKNREES